MFANRSMERVQCPPWGLWGGEPGAPPHNVVEPAQGERQEIAHGINRYPLAAGDRVTMLTGGGGGWGDPAERDPAAIQDDLRRGYVTQDRAAQDYGDAASQA